MHRGYFIHARKMKDWVARNKPNYYSIWGYLLEEASGVERSAYFNGTEIILKPGQLVTGRKKISQVTGVPETSVERVLKKFEKWGQIGQQKTTRSRLITIEKWGQYQPDGFETDNKRTTNGQQTDNKRTLTEKVKEGVEGKRRKIFKPPTISEIEDYCKERGNNIDAEYFFNYQEARGWMLGKVKMKSWKATIITWEKNEGLINRKAKKENIGAVSPKSETDEEYNARLAKNKSGSDGAYEN